MGKWARVGGRGRKEPRRVDFVIVSDWNNWREMQAAHFLQG